MMSVCVVCFLFSPIFCCVGSNLFKNETGFLFFSLLNKFEFIVVLFLSGANSLLLRIEAHKRTTD